MKLQIIEEPHLAFHQNKLHVDIRAGLSTFGAFDKGSTAVPVPIRIGVIGTTATVTLSPLAQFGTCIWPSMQP